MGAGKFPAPPSIPGTQTLVLKELEEAIKSAGGGTDVIEAVIEFLRAEQARRPMHSMTVREAFRRVGADKWDAVSDRFGVVKPALAEAAE